MSQLDSKSFSAIADLAYRESGLQLVVEKTSMIQSRLRHRLREVGATEFSDYADLVCSDAGRAERKHMISALTTNVSHFFREPHHFDILEQEILPMALKTLRAGGRFRIWSAGCSNGQEAYSIAMTALEFSSDFQSLDFKILATDIDTNVVDFASKGRYSEKFVGAVPEKLLKSFFLKCDDQEELCYEVNASLRSLVTFRELNLLLDWPMQGNFDVIFCRNVVIYFDASTQNKLWPKFRNILKADGRLFLGHSERIADPSALGFVNCGPTAYCLGKST